MSMQIVLLSGGIDSLVCAEASHRAGTLAGCVFVNYEQPAATMEVRRANGWCESRGVPFKLVHLFYAHLGDMAEGVGARVVPHRNAVLLSLAANQAPKYGASEIAIGACAADAADYADCRQPFLDAMSLALGLSVVAPLIDKSKVEVIELARELRLQQGDAWSCYERGPDPCGVCPSCVESTKAWAS